MENKISNEPVYELPQSKAILTPIISAGEEVAKALADGRIDWSEWTRIVFEGIPLASALKNLQNFVAETQILNKHPEARKQLKEWFAKELDLEGSQNAESIEWIVESTIQLALDVWNYIVGMQQHFVSKKN